MKQIFVTGGSGFVGQNLISMLIENGYQVKALARSAQAIQKVEQLGATAIKGDLNDKQALTVGVKDCSSVFHLAASVDFFASEKKLKKLHVDATELLLEVAQNANVPRFVYLSAASVIMNGKPIVNAKETFVSDNIIDGYSRTKLQAENLVLKANTENFQTIAVRPPLVWGKGDPNTLVGVMEATKKGRMQFIDGGNHRLVTCHVLNVCHALILADQSEQNGKTYFITDGETPIFKDFIKKYVATQGVTIPDKVVSLAMAKRVANVMEFVWKIFGLKGHPPLYIGLVNVLGVEFTTNDSKARKELGYKPFVTIEQGLDLMRK
ncbi:NAD-dependent epimerase/dehydratase family protein [Sphingobacterium alkalisoli]|uniref:NAD-dependent epimerase/dehydratase family protein n=1 Tax=Sphingobacterium alkalisoli TaxID=1874115 RepID=A0A4U0GX40_9SPHI|nr:NAD-dependent epimerase/dehydratase family protein [Sphingobacterium alkalisoli]TJY63715.1 NAD-dependent epimerase/dehydratase family protein [Sphingobacterium alkalisoli]GGH25332.1 3-beta hydroxysteroid dehydrogenase [Sphingobacterium alkalisoli]